MEQNCFTGKLRRCVQQFLVGFMLYVSLPAHAEEALCAQVQISIAQEAALERQGFEASMIIKNSLDNLSLNDVSIELVYTNEAGEPVEVTTNPAAGSAIFFQRLDDTVGVDSINGFGTIAPSTSAEIRWLIIPTAGAAGQASDGQLYFVGANLSYTFGGEPQSISVVPDTIVVRPQPLLTLDYFLTEEIVADDGFTTEIEAPVPYTLGVRIKNTGYGDAAKVKLESAQPTIVENEQGLAVGFKIIGAYVNNLQAAKNLAVNFGDIAPGNSSVARFIMESSLSGEFTEFSASVTHADTLGGELTSLIQAANTSLLVRDVLVDITGRDSVSDFLTIYDEGFRVYESEAANTAIAGCLDCAIVLPLAGVMDNSGNTSGTITRIVTVPATPDFTYIKWDDPFLGEKNISRVIRDDGKVLAPQNYWLSQQRSDNNIDFDYSLNIFDVDAGAVYTLTFDEFTNQPVAPVIAFMPDRTTYEGSQVGFLIQATDANGTIPNLTAAGLPSGAYFAEGSSNGNSAKGTFTWAPEVGQAGSYPITFTASDGVLSATQIVTIVVNSADDVDGDELDDAWENANFGDLSRDGNGDFDGDGYTDKEEFENATDPTEATIGLLPPEPFSPHDNAVVATLSPTLKVENIDHGAAADVQYLFEVYSDINLNDKLASIVVPEGANNTSAVIDASAMVGDATLVENESYVWRVRAYLLPEGLDYSEWRYSRFTVDVTDEVPLAPTIAYPAIGNSVDQLLPQLAIIETVDSNHRTNAAALSYGFHVFDSSAWDGSQLDTTNPVSSVTGLKSVNASELKWQLTTALIDGASYHWLATVNDDSGQSVDSALGSFTVDLSNGLPSSPAISSPLDNASVSTLAADSGLLLSVFNSTDMNSEVLSYEFEIDVVPSFGSAELMSSGSIAEGVDVTTWLVTGLTENEKYFWRVRAVDNAGTSAWQYSNFVVNQANDAPLLPKVMNPADNASVATVMPTLEATTDLDVDSAMISYIFTIYDDALLTNQIATNTQPQARWPLDIALNNNQTYYWTAQAQDDDGLLSAVTSGHKFNVRDDTEDQLPAISFIKPSSDLVVSGGLIELQWHDSDVDSNATINLFYQLDGGAQTLIASFDEDVDLNDDFYQWDTTGLLSGVYDFSLSIQDDTNTVQADSCCSVTILSAERTISVSVVDGTNLDESGVSVVEVDVALDAPLAEGTQLTLNVALSDSTEAVLVGGVSYLQFNDTNWQLPQKLFVKGVDDCLVDGDQSVSLQLSASVSDDPDYAGVDPDDLTLLNADNEVQDQMLFICHYELISQQAASGSLVDYTYKPLLTNIGQSLESASASVSVAGSDMALQSSNQLTFPTVILGTSVEAVNHFVVRLDPALGFDPAKLIWQILPGATAAINTGNSSHNTINGTAGDDIIDGKAGNDTIYAGAGDDVLIGGAGADSLHGGDGNDTFVVTGTDAHADNFYGDAGYDKVLGGDGDDTIRVSSYSGSRTVEEIDGGLGANIIEGTNSHNTMDFSNTLLVNIIHIDGLAGNDTITGSQADDVIIGNTGNDRLYGGPGDDIFPVTGSISGTDRFNGGDGNDKILATDGDDVISLSVFSGSNTVEVIDAGAGNDTVQGSRSHNTLDFSAASFIGVEQIDGLAGNDTITGTTGNDVIIGNVGSDRLYGNDGDDVFIINGSGQGSDRFNGGNGNDRIQGGPLDDVIQLSVYSGTNRVETIDGDGGINIVRGTSSHNTLDFSNTSLISIQQIEGLAGNDTITGTNQGDVIVGGIGSDRIYGGAGDDTFKTSIDAGFDRYNGGAGVDTLLASAADEEIRLSVFSSSNTVEIIDGGAGVNTILSSSSHNSLDFSNTTLIGIASIDGGAGNDTIHGSAAADTIVDSAGSDRLYGHGGDDVFLLALIDGGADRYNGGDGLDTIQGTSADDVIGLSVFSGANTVEHINGGGGVNTIVSTSSHNSLDFTATTLSDISSIDGGAGNDTIKGSAGADYIIGGIGSDRLYGGPGDDVFALTVSDTGYDRFNGGDGDDTVLGAAEDDEIRLSVFSGDNTVEVIDGGLGENIIKSSSSHNTLDFSNTMLLNISLISGGAGNDTITGSAAPDVIEGGPGSDTIYGSGGDDQFVLSDASSGFDRFNGGDGNDTLLGTDADEDIRLSVFSGTNTVETIDGGLGVNRIVSSSSHNSLDFSATTLVNIDEIDGGAGNDTISGSAGNDIIVGNLGSDTLLGNAGDDFFRTTFGDTGFDRFNGGDGLDTVEGSDADDIIKLSVFSGVNTVETIDGGTGHNIILSSGSHNSLDFSATSLVNIAEIDGGAGNDTIKGSSSADVIIGNVGSDTLSGNGGDDVFMVTVGDTGANRVNGGEGQDTVLGTTSSDVIIFSVFNGDNTVEIIDGNGALDVVVATSSHNQLDFSNTQLIGIQQIEGRAGNDTITGSQGDDVLVGGVGNDTLSGRAGNDVYRHDAGDGSDYINNLSASGDLDVLELKGALLSNNIWLLSEGNHLRIYRLNSSESIRVNNWFSGGINQISEIKLDDSSVLYAHQVQTLVDVMSSIGVPSNGAITLTAQQQLDVDAAISATWGAN